MSDNERQTQEETEEQAEAEQQACFDNHPLSPDYYSKDDVLWDLIATEQERDVRGAFLNRVVVLAQKHGFEQNGWLDSIAHLEAVLNADRERIKELQAALKPFAELAQTYAASERKWHGEGEPREPFLEWLNWRDDDEIRAACEQASTALGS